MLVETLDGHQYEWKVTGHDETLSTRKKSQYHTKAKELLIELFPTAQILEEVDFKPYKHKPITLYMDFYLPLYQICVEVHGKQHYEYTHHFHGSKINWFKQKQNDKDKYVWCHINNITCIELPYNEDIEQWQKKLAFKKN